MKIRKYWFCYLAVFLAAAGLRCLYCSADSDRLLWILTPTVWWVRALSGLAFVYESGIGYVNHGIRFIIAPACAGVRFLIICMLMLVCSFTHCMGTWKRGLGYTVFSMGFSWMFTVFVNGLRIILSIYLPPVFEKIHILNALLTQEQLHTAIGTTMYFLSLMALYGLMEAALRKLSGESERSGGGRYILPALWYFFMVLGVPLLLRILRNDYTDFADYARFVMRVCLTSLCMFGIVFWTGGLMKKRLSLSDNRSGKRRLRI